MADIGGRAATRLRRTFRYPTDQGDADNSGPEAMDEEEQEELIQRLTTENTSRDAFFARLLLALPLLTTVVYIPTLPRLPSILAITSLLATAFLLYSLPPNITGIPVLDQQFRSANRSSTGSTAAVAAATAPFATFRSPLEIWLPYLNLGLVAALVLLNMVTKSENASLGWIGAGNLPAIVYAAVLAAKLVMASVDPESELSALRYEYKGA